MNGKSDRVGWYKHIGGRGTGEGGRGGGRIEQMKRPKRGNGYEAQVLRLSSVICWGGGSASTPVSCFFSERENAKQERRGERRGSPDNSDCTFPMEGREEGFGGSYWYQQSPAPPPTHRRHSTCLSAVIVTPFPPVDPPILILLHFSSPRFIVHCSPVPIPAYLALNLHLLNISRHHSIASEGF